MIRIVAAYRDPNPFAADLPFELKFRVKLGGFSRGNLVSGYFRFGAPAGGIHPSDFERFIPQILHHEGVSDHGLVFSIERTIVV
jgi:hypothetical protein